MNEAIETIVAILSKFSDVGDLRCELLLFVSKFQTSLMKCAGLETKSVLQSMNHFQETLSYLSQHQELLENCAFRLDFHTVKFIGFNVLPQSIDPSSPVNAIQLYPNQSVDQVLFNSQCNNITALHLLMEQLSERLRCSKCVSISNILHSTNPNMAPLKKRKLGPRMFFDGTAELRGEPLNSVASWLSNTAVHGIAIIADIGIDRIENFGVNDFFDVLHGSMPCKLWSMNQHSDCGQLRLCEGLPCVYCEAVWMGKWAVSGSGKVHKKPASLLQELLSRRLGGGMHSVEHQIYHITSAQLAGNQVSAFAPVAQRSLVDEALPAGWWSRPVEVTFNTNGSKDLLDERTADSGSSDNGGGGGGENVLTGQYLGVVVLSLPDNAECLLSASNARVTVVYPIVHTSNSSQSSELPSVLAAAMTVAAQCPEDLWRQVQEGHVQLSYKMTCAVEIASLQALWRLQLTGEESCDRLLTEAWPRDCVWCKNSRRRDCCRCYASSSRQAAAVTTHPRPHAGQDPRTVLLPMLDSAANMCHHCEFSIVICSVPVTSETVAVTGDSVILSTQLCRGFTGVGMYPCALEQLLASLTAEQSVPAASGDILDGEEDEEVVGMIKKSLHQIAAATSGSIEMQSCDLLDMFSRQDRDESHDRIADRVVVKVTMLSKNALFKAQLKGGGVFCPSLATQRQRFVTELLRASQATSWLDLGCGNGSFLADCLKLNAVNSSHAAGGSLGCALTLKLQRIAGLDIRDIRLREAAAAILKTQQAVTDSTVSSRHESNRGSHLHHVLDEVMLWECSMLDAAVCGHLAKYQLPASFVTCIEVIEHLPSVAMAALALDNILMQLCPQWSLISTPNYEANKCIRQAAHGSCSVADDNNNGNNNCSSRRNSQDDRSNRDRLKRTLIGDQHDHNYINHDNNPQCQDNHDPSLAPVMAAAAAVESFREEDHKFEFSRQEFEAFLQAALGRSHDYWRGAVHYSLETVHLGCSLPGMQMTGGATQCAVLTRHVTDLQLMLQIQNERDEITGTLSTAVLLDPVWQWHR